MNLRGRSERASTRTVFTWPCCGRGTPASIGRRPRGSPRSGRPSSSSRTTTSRSGPGTTCRISPSIRRRRHLRGLVRWPWHADRHCRDVEVERWRPSLERPDRGRNGRPERAVVQPLHRSDEDGTVVLTYWDDRNNDPDDGIATTDIWLRHSHDGAGSRSSTSMVRSTCTTRRSRSSSRATHIGWPSGTTGPRDDRRERRDQLLRVDDQRWRGRARAPSEPPAVNRDGRGGLRAAPPAYGLRPFPRSDRGTTKRIPERSSSIEQVLLSIRPSRFACGTSVIWFRYRSCPRLRVIIQT